MENSQKRRVGAPTKPPDKRISKNRVSIGMTDDELAMFMAEADRRHISLGQFLREAGRQAVKR